MKSVYMSGICLMNHVSFLLLKDEFCCVCLFFIWTQVVGWMTGKLHMIPTRDWDFYFLCGNQTFSRYHSASCLLGVRGLFQTLEHLGCISKDSSLCSTGIKNAMSYTFTCLYVCMSWCLVSTWATLLLVLDTEESVISIITVFFFFFFFTKEPRNLLH